MGPAKKRHKAPEKKTEPTTWKDRAILVVVLLLVAATLGGMILLQLRYNAAAHESRMQAKYHLTDEQLVHFTALEKEHREIYGALRQRAETTKKEVEARIAEENEISAGTRQLFDQAQAEREACWTEEITHHRRVSKILAAEEARLYLAEKEQRYQKRRNDANGFLVLPHK